MADTSKFWLHDGEQHCALVTGEAERDRIEQPGLVPVSALETLWGPLGWVAGPPPGGVHPVTSAPRADQPAETKPDPKPAAGGTEKGK
jgi:hypothetical protein